MNKKYERYIDYIVNDIEAPYFDNMKEMYGLRPDEYKLIFGKVFNQPVTMGSNQRVYDKQGKTLYREYSDGHWYKYEYDTNDNIIYREDSNGYWYKREYNTNGNLIYSETSNGVIEDNR